MKKLVQNLEARPLRTFFLAYLFAFLSLVLLKIQIASARGFGKAWNEGLAWGFVLDALVIGLPFLFGILAQRIKHRWLRNLWLIAPLAFYVASLATTLHFMFFGGSLPWWTVVDYFHGASAGNDDPAQLSFVPYAVLSVAVFGMALALAYLSSEKKLWSFPKILGPFGFLFDAVVAAVLIVAIVGIQQSPLDHRDTLKKILGSTNDVLFLRSPIMTQPFIEWLPAMSGHAVIVAGETPSISFQYLSPEEKKNPAAVLRAFREKNIDSIKNYLGTPYPLHDDFKIDTRIRHQWRQALGFNDTEKLSTLFMFLESFRAYELTDPVQGPLLYPRLTKIFNEHAVYLSRGYTSAFLAGQTVRGMWQTFCSLLPDMMGPAPYLANARVHADCLPEFLSSQGYHTSSLAATAATYHNERAFEELHGTQQINDKFDYDSANETSWTGWGVPDQRYFEKYLDYANRETANGRPFFMQGINTNTHGPFRNVPGAPMPEGWFEKTGVKWADFHGAFHRLDNELADFIENFLKSPAADHAYLVLSGDHSVSAEMPPSISERQNTEIKFRIPVVFISKFIKKPIHIVKPFHEVDVGITIATIDGDPNVARPWARLGQVLSPDANFSGSDWVYLTFARELFYRKNDHSCYSIDKKQTLKCYSDREGDPMYSKNLSEIPADPKETIFFNKLSEADFLTVSRNKIAPRDPAKPLH